MTTLTNLIERIADGEDRDALVSDGSLLELARFVWDNPMRGSEIYEALDGNLHYAIRIVNERLPGWIYKVCRCHISDDAWLVPDYNDPAHKQRFADEIGDFAARSIWDEGFDVALNPPHGREPARALLIATLEALKAYKAKLSESPLASEGVSAAGESET